MAQETEPIYIRRPNSNQTPSVFIGDTPFIGSQTVAKVEGDFPTPSEIRASTVHSRRKFLLKAASVAALPLAVLVSKYK